MENVYIVIWQYRPDKYRMEKHIQGIFDNPEKASRFISENKNDTCEFDDDMVIEIWSVE